MKITDIPAVPLHADPGNPDPRNPDLREAARGFEELLLGQLLKAARAAGPGDALTGGSAVTRTTEMLDSQLARQMAGHVHFGIAEAIERQFSKHPAGRK